MPELTWPDGKTLALKAFLDHVAGQNDVWITARRTIAERVAECCPWEGAA